MIKKLIKHGNSAALIIDKPILDLLHVTMDTPLEVITDGKNIIISPKKNIHAGKEILMSLQKINKLHGETLKKLAE